MGGNLKGVGAELSTLKIGSFSVMKIEHGAMHKTWPRFGTSIFRMANVISICVV
jgi:hypothetical protein